MQKETNGMQDQNQYHQKYLSISFLCVTNFFLDKFLKQFKYQHNLMLKGMESTIQLYIFHVPWKHLFDLPITPPLVWVDQWTPAEESNLVHGNLVYCYCFPVLPFFPSLLSRRVTRWWNTDGVMKILCVSTPSLIADKSRLLEPRELAIWQANKALNFLQTDIKYHDNWQLYERLRN